MAIAYSEIDRIVMFVSEEYYYDYETLFDHKKNRSQKTCFFLLLIHTNIQLMIVRKTKQYRVSFFFSIEYIFQCLEFRI